MEINVNQWIESHLRSEFRMALSMLRSFDLLGGDDELPITLSLSLSDSAPVRVVAADHGTADVCLALVDGELDVLRARVEGPTICLVGDTRWSRELPDDRVRVLGPVLSWRLVERPYGLRASRIPPALREELGLENETREAADEEHPHDDERRKAAYHEAGHAVAAVYAGEFVHALQISDDPRGELLTTWAGTRPLLSGLADVSGTYVPGVSSHDRLRESGAPLAMVEGHRRCALVSLVVNLAGPLAEARASDRSRYSVWNGAENDLLQWQAILRDFPAAMRKTLSDEAERGAELLVDHFWDAIEALAEELLRVGSMDGLEAQELVLGVLAQREPVPGIPQMPHANWTSRARSVAEVLAAQRGDGQEKTTTA